MENYISRRIRVGATLILAGLPVAMASVPALAYVGPGAGVSMLGALWAVIFAVLLAIGGILYWPIRSMLRKRRANAAATAKDETPAEEVAPNPSER